MGLFDYLPKHMEIACVGVAMTMGWSLVAGGIVVESRVGGESTFIDFFGSICSSRTLRYVPAYALILSLLLLLHAILINLNSLLVC